MAATNQVQGSQDQEELTTGEVLQRLQDAWINEKFAPDLLEHQNEVVECLLNQIAEIDQRIDSERLQRKKDQSKNFGSALYKMEVARVRFVISSYLRIRLEKIQRFVFYLLEQESKVKCLVFLIEQILQHFSNSAISALEDLNVYIN